MPVTSAQRGWAAIDAFMRLKEQVDTAREQSDGFGRVYGIPIVLTEFVPRDRIFIATDPGVPSAVGTVYMNPFRRDGHFARLPFETAPLFTTRCVGMIELARDRRRGWRARSGR